MVTRSFCCSVAGGEGLFVESSRFGTEGPGPRSGPPGRFIGGRMWMRDEGFVLLSESAIGVTSHKSVQTYLSKHKRKNRLFKDDLPVNP